MKLYNHAYNLAFEVISYDEDGKDITPEIFETALQRRINALNEFSIWEECLGGPFDTFEITSDKEN